MLFYVLLGVLFVMFVLMTALLLKKTAENDRLIDHNHTLQREIFEVSKYAQELKLLKEAAEADIKLEKEFEIAYIDLRNACCQAFGLNKADMAKKAGRGNFIIVQKLKELNKD